MGVLDEDVDGSISRGVKAEYHLEESIRTGRLPVGMKLPSQRALAAEYEVAKSTMQGIVLNLTYKGLIRTEPGRGTYVAPRHAADLARLGATYPDERVTGVGRMELTPEEAKTLDLVRERRVAEMVGLFYLTVRDIFAGASFVDVREEGLDLLVVEWAGGPPLRDVIAEVGHHRAKPGSAPWSGMPGLRVVHVGVEEAQFIWIPEMKSRLVLRRRFD